MHAVLCDDASVHLADWPDADALPADAELVRRMDLAREVCSAALSIRTDKGLRVRQPAAVAHGGLLPTAPRSSRCAR